MTGAFLDAPEFAAPGQFVGIDGLRSLTDQHGAPGKHRDVRSGKGLAKIAFRFGFALRPKILEIDGALVSPDCFPGLFVQRNDELMVAAVEVHQEQIPEKDGRRASAAIVVALEIPSFPEHSGGTSVETGGAGRTEGHIDPALFDHRCRRSVSIELMCKLRLLDCEQFEIMENPAAVAIHANGEEFLAVFRSRGEPDLVVPNHRRGPGAPVNGCLPSDMVGFAPTDGQPARLARAVPAWPTELRPRVAHPSDDREDREDHWSAFRTGWKRVLP